MGDEMLEVVDIRLVWNAVRPGVEQIHANLPWVDWRPEDIYAACTNGDSALITKQGVDASEAFMIVRMDVNQRTGEKILFIWLAWCPDETGAAEIYLELDQLAMGNGCSAIEFITGEKKLVEFADQFGFRKVMYEVRKDLPGPTAPGQ
tara:strand:+ start:216 stop:659 length:444 start_codon:yes stop_codon:yes gene_type:complete